MSKIAVEMAHRIARQKAIEHSMKVLMIMNANVRTERMFLVNVEEHTAVELLASFDVRIPNVGS